MRGLLLSLCVCLALGDDETAPWERNGGNYIQGDIAMSREEYETLIARENAGYRALYDADSLEDVAFNAIRSESGLWPNRVVPYVIGCCYNGEERRTILKAIEAFNDRTCLSIRPKQHGDKNWIHIQRLGGCFSLVGKSYREGAQDLSIGSGCVGHGTIIHEIMHAVGFHHEQARADRDDFVRVQLWNVADGLESQFDKETLEVIQHLNAPYDYGSVMHYSSHAFSKNRQPTIVKLKKEGPRLGNRAGFSDWDVIKINRLYGCKAPPPKPPPPVTPPRPTQICRKETRQLAHYRKVAGEWRGGGDLVLPEGGSLPGHGTKGSRGPDYCANVCGQWETCVGFEWDKADRVCWYKQAWSPGRPRASMDVYIRKCGQTITPPRPTKPTRPVKPTKPTTGGGCSGSSNPRSLGAYKAVPGEHRGGGALVIIGTGGLRQHLPRHGESGTRDAAFCANACGQWPPCVGFEWNKLERSCWYKSEWKPGRPNADIDVYEKGCGGGGGGGTKPTRPTPAPPTPTTVTEEPRPQAECFQLRAGHRRPGGDLFSIPALSRGSNASKSLELCALLCERYPRCLGFELTREGHACRFKAVLNPTVVDAAVDVYEKTCLDARPVASAGGTLSRDEMEEKCIYEMDLNKNCGDWARSGRCDSEGVKMWRFCRRSCCLAGESEP